MNDRELRAAEPSEIGNQKSGIVNPVDPVLSEVLDHLDMPRAGVRTWIAKSVQAYCLDHGGRKYYGELMDLYDELRTTLDAAERTPRGD